MTHLSLNPGDEPRCNLPARPTMSHVSPRANRGTYNKPTISTLQASYLADRSRAITLPRLTFLDRPLYWWERRQGQMPTPLLPTPEAYLP